ncbi:MAG: hypothetical protein WAL30_01465 [Candidatus Aquirickettsiella sp.]
MPKESIQKNQPNKIKFQSVLPHNSSENLLKISYAVSKDNERQTKDKFAIFVKWIIENKCRITKFQIILSDFLNRYYIGELEAIAWGERWKNENKAMLEQLQLEGVSYELLDWKFIINKETYSEVKKKVDQLYRDDQEFQIAINGLATSHQNKAGYGSAINYLLEESAGLALLDGVLTYPSPKLNGAIHCAFCKLNIGPNYIGHMFIYSKSVANPAAPLHKAAFNFLCALDQTNHKTEESKYNFFYASLKSHEPLNHKKNFAAFSEELDIRNKLISKSNYNIFLRQLSKEIPILTNKNINFQRGLFRRCSI